LEDYLLLNRLSEQEPQRIVAVPLVVRGRTVAVLYADSAGLDSDAINLEALETLVRVAAMAVGLLSVAHAAAARPQAEPVAKPEEQVEASTETAPAYTPAREYEEPSHVEFTGEAPHEASESTPQAESEPAAAFFMPTPATVEPAAAPLGSRRRHGSYDAELPVEVSDEDEKRQHNDARRFARLLVSEIKLYNEQKVVEGRTQGNLYERLREYIDRSREMYDKRVKAGVSAKYDYFHHELVNTLAEGDASKLGAEYPGAAVSA